MKNKPIYRFSACVVAAALLFSAATAGVCLCHVGAPAGGKSGVCMVSLDVCGKAGQSVAAPGMDAALTPYNLVPQFFPDISLIPPTPVRAVASACTGEDEKPPEA